MRPTFVKHLRTNMTDAERRLWYLLRGHRFGGAKFKRQVPIGPYIVDFACMTHGLVVEVDGGQHSESQPDKVRDAWLNVRGLRILRFWNNEVLMNTDGVMKTIADALDLSEPKPLSRRAARATLSLSGRGEER